MRDRTLSILSKKQLKLVSKYLLTENHLKSRRGSSWWLNANKWLCRLNCGSSYLHTLETEEWQKLSTALCEKKFDYYFSFPITWNIIKCVCYCFFFSPGAIGSSLLAYILPCLFHLKLCHRDLPWLVCFKDSVIILLGVLCSIVSLYSVIVQLAKNTSV